jgi:uncharacterized protein (DUF1330 family)
MRHNDHGTTHLSTEIDTLHDRINNEYRVFSAGSVRKWSKFGLMDHGRFLILEGQGPVQGVTVYEFPSRDAARSWYDSAASREVRQHRKKGAKYLAILTEGGVPPVEQRMPHTTWL